MCRGSCGRHTEIVSDKTEAKQNVKFCSAAAWFKKMSDQMKNATRCQAEVEKRKGQGVFTVMSDWLPIQHGK